MDPKPFFASITIVACALRALAADPFTAGVRTTEPLTPEQQRRTFHLPPGFEIQLVAAEPDLRKPMNMAFDAAGRLWVTESREYPFPAKIDAEARDTIRIFADFGPDGRARSVTTFATNLNIPIGLHPFRSPSSKGGTHLTWKCAAWSIPNIWLFEDTDGDGRADRKEILYGPFDHTRDTHGNQASFRRGLDGWLYATHGFSNQSRVKGRDGHEIFLPSGNTYRMRLDGTRVEHWTHGQVNPFGMCADPLGNFYTADCHSSPIYQLIPGAHYPSFGKPHDGLGFAPQVIQHSHGSTAISGIVYISDPSWPAEFQDNMLVGNVMTSRINRDRITFHGSSPKGTELPDFLTTDDPWFRPVDLQWGPDGALYIADFYNRIIGHYEVPLTHPARDRERGRIWRVVRRPGARPDTKLADGLNSPINELLSQNPVRRALAREELAVRTDAQALDTLRQAARGLWHFRESDDRAALMPSALWLLHRHAVLDEETLLAALNDRDHAVRVHALRILAETPTWKPAAAQAATAALRDGNPHVQRTAAEALARHADAAHIHPLLSLLHTVPAEDAHLRHTVRLALRNQLLPEGNLAKLGADKLSEADSRALADLATAVTSASTGAFLAAHLQRFGEDRDAMVRYLRHAVRYSDDTQADTLARLARRKFPADLDMQLALFKSMQEGAAQRGAALTAALRDWGAELAPKLLAATGSSSTWTHLPLEGMTGSKPTWAFQERLCADGVKARFLSSFPNGETLTGVIRSGPFSLPAHLSFYLCGHDGIPGKPAQKKNHVRLIDAATRQVLREAVPPRNDTAHKVVWPLAEFAGKTAYFEAADADPSASYAWLAFGRFEPALPALDLPPPLPLPLAQRQQAGAELARVLKLKPTESVLAKLFADPKADAGARSAAARALLAMDARAHLPAVGQSVTNSVGAIPALLREEAALALAETDLPEALPPLLIALRNAPRPLQVKLAATLAGKPGGAERLLAAVAARQLTPQLLLEKTVRDRLEISAPTDLARRLAALTRDVPPLETARQKLIEQRRIGFNAARASAAKGANVFTRACAACHRLGEVGALVGPQLEGIGARGLERLLEDLLDPNRNVDPAFRSTTFLLADGEVENGLVRREEGELIVLATSSGQEVRIPKKQIRQRRDGGPSLMPDNFGEVITPEEFNDLLAFLISRQAEAGTAK